MTSFDERTTSELINKFITDNNGIKATLGGTEVTLTTKIQGREIARQILKETDWTQIPNSGLTSTSIENFKTYRDALRVISKTEPDNPSFPQPPKEEWV